MTVSAQAVFASDTFRVTGTLPLGTHLFGKHDVVSATPTPPPCFGIARGPSFFLSLTSDCRGKELLALLTCRGLDFHLAHHLGHCAAIAAAVATIVATIVAAIVAAVVTVVAAVDLAVAAVDLAVATADFGVATADLAVAAVHLAVVFSVSSSQLWARERGNWE